MKFGMLALAAMSLTIAMHPVAPPPTQTQPLIEAIHVNSTCTASLPSDCLDNATWPTAFDSANYRVTCSGIVPHVVPVLVGIESKTASGFNIRMSARQVAGSPSSFEGYDCIGVGTTACTDISQGCGVRIISDL